MKHETQCKKCCIAIGSAIHIVFFGVVGILFAVWWKNEQNINSWWLIDRTDSDCSDKYNFYNLLPLSYYYDGLENFSDTTEAQTYMMDIGMDCDVTVSASMTDT